MKGNIELLDQAIEQLGLEHISADIYDIYANIKAKGYDQKVKIAGAIYIACQKNGIPTTITRIAKHLGVKEKHMFKLLKKQGLLRPTFKALDEVLMNTLKYVRQKTMLTNGEFNKLKKSAKAWLDKIVENKVSGKPLTLVCTAIYLAGLEQGLDSKSGLTQKWFEENIGITEVSIRNAITQLFGKRCEEEVSVIVRKQRVLELLKEGVKSIDELAHRIGVSISAIRNIVYRLVDEGLVDVKINKGRLMVSLKEVRE